MLLRDAERFRPPCETESETLKHREDVITQLSSGDKHSIMREDAIIQCPSEDKHSIMREDVITQCLQEINTAL